MDKNVFLGSNCATCSKSIEGDSIVCRQCKSSYHKSCVTVNDNMELWTCQICKGVLNVPPPPKSNRSRSVCSHRSKRSSASSKAELLLKHCDEEQEMLRLQQQEKEKLIEDRAKMLEEKHKLERELFMKKQQILQESFALCDERSRGSIPVPSISSKEKVQSWVKDNSKIGESIAKSQFNEEQQNLELQLTERQPDIPERKTTDIMDARTAIQSTANEMQKEDHITFHSSQIRPTFNVSSSRILSKEQIASRHVLKELPSFDGKPKLWPKFISSFQRSTFLCGFNDSENLERLSRSLHGSAYAAVESSLTLEDNVPRILETLELLFGKPEFIINSLLEDLKKSKPPTFESIDSIMCYALEIENIACTMKIGQLPEHLWNPLLLSEMLEKLPSQMKIEWAEFMYKKPACNIEIFSTWLKEKAMKLSRLLTKPPTLGKPFPRIVEKSKSGYVHVHDGIPKEFSCCICEGSCKSVEQCETFKNLNHQSKLQAIKKNQICRSCLKKHRGTCWRQEICGIDDCEFLHHELLHKHQNTQRSPENVVPANVNAHHSPNFDCLFKVLPVKIHFGNKSVRTFAMLDDCSSITLISQDIAKELCAEGPKQSLCLQWTSNVKRIEHNSQQLSLQISSDSTNKLYRLNCRTLENLSLPKQSLDYQQLSSQYDHLKNLPISSYENANIGLLIGINNPILLLTNNYKVNKEYEPIAAQTKLGHVIFGSNIDNNAGVFHVRECDCSQNFLKLDQLIRENYAAENMGISKTEELRSREDQRAYNIWEKETKFLGNRFETGLIFKYDKFKLPNSYNMALRRLQCLLKKCEKEAGLRNHINDIILEYIVKGYAREVSEIELQSYQNDRWFLPIFVVRNPNKPEKLRLVWDAAATVNETSLNSVLMKGPDLLSNLLGILLRFRQYKIAMSADIQEMFHQIRIKPEDQKYQLFLWPDESNKIKVYTMVGMTFGASCSPATAQYIKNINAKRFEKQFPRAVEAIIENHYVDDLLESVEDEAMGLELAQNVLNIHKNAGFNIRNWISNSEFISNSLQSSSTSTKRPLQFASESILEKVLGMWWETTTDELTFSLRYHKLDQDIWNGDRAPTKREVLRAVMSIYDPLGLLANLLIFPKILLQNIWRTESAWDEAINPELTNDWTSWINLLPEVEKVKIPRWYGYSSKINHVDLHVFTDASCEAYAAVVYMRFFDPDTKSFKVVFVTAKSRVAPLKYVSIPRLELTGAVVGVRITQTVKANLKINIRKITYWTDSTCVLSWIYSDHKKYKPYVAARVSEILESSASSDWRYVPTNDNVADEATKSKIIHPNSTSRWYSGPEFLYKNEAEWPKNKVKKNEAEEMMGQYLVSINVHHAEISTSKFSSWTKLCRVQGYVNRFITKVKCKVLGSSVPEMSNFLSCQELRKAENILYRQAQEEGYPEEISCLESGVNIQKDSKVYKDLPYLDEFSVMRARSRIDAVDNIPFFVKRPILLPKDNRITTLIMQYYHKLYHHSNSNTVINELRQKYIIPSMRTKLRSIKNGCQWCKNRSAMPRSVEMGPLPSARLTTFTQAFNCIGIDYFGPLYVAVRRSREKRWAILITCLTTRAVHLEVAHSLTTDSCILGLRRFMSRRGVPRQIFSDNATNFKCASKEIKSALENVNSKLLAQHFTTVDTDWSFIPPASPHMGGAWERMVRSVKSVMYSTFPLANTPTDEMLLTILLEAENIINSRPLTYVPLESELDEALTPNHFILGSSNGIKSMCDAATNGKYLRHSWKQSQIYADLIWKKWLKEILPDLRRRTKWYADPAPIKLNDIVLVIEENTPRNCYKKAKVIGLHEGKDGKIRSVSIQTQNGILVRPVNKLAVLDVYQRESIPNEEGIPGGSVVNSPISTSTTLNNCRRLRPLPHRK